MAENDPTAWGAVALPTDWGAKPVVQEPAFEDESSSLWGHTKALASGLGSGTIGLINAVNPTNLGARVAKLGATGEMPPDPIQQTVESVTGEFYKPQTPGEEYTHTVGEMLPSAVAGPGGVTRRIGQAVASGLASQFGGNQAKEIDPSLEPVGRLLGAVTPSAIESSAMRMRAKVPSSEDLKTASTAGYNKLKTQNVLFDKRDTDYLADSVEKILTAEGYRPVTGIAGSPVFKAIDELRDMVQATKEGRAPNFHDIEAVRKHLNIIGKTPEHRDAVRLAQREIDDFLVNISATKQARGNYAAYKRDQLIHDALENANLRASSSGSGANIDNTMRQEIRKILKDKKRIRGFNEEEVAMMKAIVKGSLPGNALRYVGKLAPTGIVPFTLTESLAHFLGTPKGWLEGVGYVAKKSSDMLTKRKVSELQRAVRSRSPEGGGSYVPPGSARDASFMRAYLAARHSAGEQLEEGEE